jgi:hypothetical protein
MARDHRRRAVAASKTPPQALRGGEPTAFARERRAADALTPRVLR